MPYNNIQYVMYMYCVLFERKFDIFMFGVASKAFKQYSEADTVEKIDEMIHDEKARIECQYQSNPQVKLTPIIS